MSDLTGRDLDRAIAEAMGWEQNEFETAYWYDEPGADAPSDRPLPHFHRSLDALRDGPEKVLREASMVLGLHVEPTVARAGWASLAASRIDYSGYGSTEAEARARACLAALQTPEGAK